MDDLTSQDLLGLVGEIDPNLRLKIKDIQIFEIIFIYLESIIILNIPGTKFGICYPIKFIIRLSLDKLIEATKYVGIFLLFFAVSQTSPTSGPSQGLKFRGG